MKFTLKDYQEEAVKDVLAKLRKAAKRWHEDGDKHAFALTATTGAGKTVMAAAVFEALFHGDNDLDFDPDPGAVIIWFSDDPSLNTQSLHRLQEASDKLPLSDMLVVQNTFNREKLEAGKIYFLNTQKLGKKSLLVRGFDPENPQTVMPDLRSFTIWDTIRNTIEDPDLTLYLVLDEAHRGMKSSNKSGTDEKPTIVKRLVNGYGGVPGIPVVLGVSATVERFKTAMEGAQNRIVMPDVEVDSVKVQDSGLLKDTIILDVPDDKGQFDTVLVRRGTDKLKQITEDWAQYAKEQSLTETVKPLMVLQVKNTPDPKDVSALLDTIYERWPDLSPDAIAHVFGEHKTQNFGAYSIPYIKPERVQDSDWVRVLLAKDAISTGWDCPRAEVMVSFRAAKDKTHITQLLGRMVRTPLARRIPGNERLNSVDCLLPFFDAKSVEAVADALMYGGDGKIELPGRKVLINPKELLPNPDIEDEVWDKLLSLPSQSLPKRQARPVKRLTALAHELALDELLPNAGKKAHAEMHKVLDGAQVRYADEISAARKAVMTVEGKSVKTDLENQSKTFDEFLEKADYRVIDDAYNKAKRVTSPDLARSYSEFLAEKDEDADDIEEALIDAHVVVAAIGLVPDIKNYLDEEAEKLAKKWLNQYRVQIKSLSDERQDVYRQIQEMSVDPLDVYLARPSSWMQTTTILEADGTEKPLPLFPNHLLVDENKMFPQHFTSSWEGDVVTQELKRSGTVAWYRNPSRTSQDSLGITYQEGDAVKIVRPDFIFFSKLDDGSIVADIIDPHGIQFADALPKLKGLAAYAEKYPQTYRRIEAIAKIDGTYKVLDVTEPGVRAEIAQSDNIESLYKSKVASKYS